MPPIRGNLELPFLMSKGCVKKLCGYVSNTKSNKKNVVTLQIFDEKKNALERLRLDFLD